MFVNLKQFDYVELLTTKNVTYISAPPQTVIKPEGLWLVSAVVATNELIVVKENIVIRIPASDVLKKSELNINDLDTVLKGLLNHG